jgi:uncharacterized protein
MYLAHRSDSWPMQAILWRFVRERVLEIRGMAPADSLRMAELMEQYKDTPMDLVDAALVALAERLGQARIFTLAHHFRIHRINGTRAFDIVP